MTQRKFEWAAGSLALMVMLMMPLGAAGQAAAEMPGVDQVLARYVEALGGRAAIEKLTSRVSKGSFEVPEQGAMGSIEILNKAPNKQALFIEIDGFGMIRQVYDGAAGWAENPQAGIVDVSGEQLANMKRGAEFYLPLKLREVYAKMEAKGREKVDGRDVYVIQADAGDGRARKMYFDAETGLLNGNDAEVDTPMGPATIQTRFSDYKEVDGVQLAFTVRTMRPQFSTIVKLAEVKHNVEIDDARFKKP